MSSIYFLLILSLGPLVPGSKGAPTEASVGGGQGGQGGQEGQNHQTKADKTLTEANPISEVLSFAREAVDEGTALLKRVFEPLSDEVRATTIKLLRQRADIIRSHRDVVDARVKNLSDNAMDKMRKWLLEQMSKLQDNMLSSLDYAIEMLNQKNFSTTKAP